MVQSLLTVFFTILFMAGDVSGTWVLDKTQTRKIPPALDTYTMVVRRTERGIAVETTIEGNLPQTDGPSRRAGAIGSEPGFESDDLKKYDPNQRGALRARTQPSQGTALLPNGVILGMPVRLGLAKAAYELDGRERVLPVTVGEEGIELMLTGREKNGIIDLRCRRASPNGSSMMRERWRLSEDGRTLTVSRSAQTPNGGGDMVLVFKRQ